MPNIKLWYVEEFSNINKKRFKKKKEKRDSVLGRKTGERGRLRETERMSTPKSGICLFKFHPAALAKLSDRWAVL